MSLPEQIESLIRQLPPEMQKEVLDFAISLQRRVVSPQPVRKRALREHPAFGSWRNRKIDALNYQQSLRAEWDHRSSTAR
jgi:hypothetical protein